MTDQHPTSSSILAQSEPSMAEPSSAATDLSDRPVPAPLTAIERRILGVLMEKARTTPDVYPLSLSGLVTGCNQKSNRHPLMNLTSERVEDALIAMRQKQLVAEVHSGGRVPKYRHYAYDYLGVKGVEAAVMTELLLRGEQTAGELRTRASRFDAIADLDSMHQILDRLIEKGLVVALTPAGRGQMFSHNLYEASEFERLQMSLGERQSETESPETAAAPSRTSAASQEMERLQAQLQELQSQVDDLRSRIEALES
jgi:uncharacterized protein YceH (UPF0502 family)